MISSREVAKSIIAEMQGVVRECSPVEAKAYRRLAIIDYAQALKHSGERTPEQNERAFQDAAFMAEKAISKGACADKLEDSFRGLRAYWLPRLSVAL